MNIFQILYLEYYFRVVSALQKKQAREGSENSAKIPVNAAQVRLEMQ